MTSPLTKRLSLSLLVLLFASGASLGQQVNIPLNNWTVPPYRSSGITTMVDQTPPRLFIGLPPCRLLDTRNNLNPLGGGGPFAANQIRNYTLPGNCGIPSGTDAVSLNMTVTNTVSNPFGFLKVWPVGQPEPNVSTLNWSTGGVTVANAAIVPLGTGGAISVKSGNAGSDVIIDINGYFSDAPGNPANSLLLANNSPGDATALFSNAATASNSWGVRGTQGNAFAIPGYFGAGVRGESLTDGVLGISQFQGVAGSVLDVGGSEQAFGILGFHSGADYGVFGQTYSNSVDGAGVRGVGKGGGIPSSLLYSYPVGVRGENLGGTGVLGLGTEVGVRGYHVNPATGGIVGGGLLGSVTEGVYFINGLTGTGTKNFVEPHPTDASKVIKFISLEGNESGTYFRGRARIQNGLAVIPVPEDFRMVTGPEGLSIQVTPIGQMASVAVESIGLDRIVVRGSRNVEFFYTVNGVRRAYPNAQTVVANEYFVPESPDARLPDYLSPDERQRLIENGTYRLDGTVNMETAHRLGWDRKWEQRSPPASQPSVP